MITKWKISNFKSVRKDTELSLAPLTIFAGPNSSGKSTWIQSILLISQTLAGKVSSRSVVLNGNLTRLGQFDDLRSFNSNKDQILIGWECQPQSEEIMSIRESLDPSRSMYYRRVSESLKSVSCEISFDVDTSSSQRDLMQLQPRLSSCKVSCVKEVEEDNNGNSYIKISRVPQESGELSKIKRLKIPTPEDQSILPKLDFDISIDDESLRELREELASATPVGCQLRHFLPYRLYVHFDKVEEEARLIVSAICEEGTRLPRFRRRYWSDDELMVPVGVIELLKTRLGKLADPIFEISDQQLSLFDAASSSLKVSDLYERMRRLIGSKRVPLRRAAQEIAADIHVAAKAGRKSEYALTSYGLPLAEDIAEAINYLDHFFSSSVKYLGPLRDEPKPLYPLAATVDPSDVGLRGEYTAAVFDLHKSRVINYIPSVNFASPAVKLDSVPSSLESAILDWLHYLGVAEGIETRDRGKLGHELRVTTQGMKIPHDLTHVGVGVSQVLPILVTCLLAERDTTLIIEQPELHLHPRVQTLLADFFLSMANLGKQCIIETHSEYIINRLRFRIAAAFQDNLSAITKIYFVEKKEGVSIFRDVKVNKYGAIPEWPEGFFDQSQYEAEEILRAATLKRNRQIK